MRFFIIFLLVSLPAFADDQQAVMDSIHQQLERDGEDTNRQLDQIRIEDKLRDQQRQIDLQRAEIERMKRDERK